MICKAGARVACCGMVEGAARLRCSSQIQATSRQLACECVTGLLSCVVLYTIALSCFAVLLFVLTHA